MSNRVKAHLKEREKRGKEIRVLWNLLSSKTKVAWPLFASKEMKILMWLSFEAKKVSVRNKREKKKAKNDQVALGKSKNLYFESFGTFFLRKLRWHGHCSLQKR